MIQPDLSESMDIEELYNYCMAIAGAEATAPFGESTLVMKICGKMFALIPLDAEAVSISLKCDPEKAESLRREYACVTGAYHMNKKYWNTITVDGEMSHDELKRWINHSVDEVLAKLPKRIQNEYYANIKD